MTHRLPPAITEALQATGKPWEITQGGQHLKILVAGRFVGILPGNGRDAGDRSLKNVVSQIRRAGKLP